MAESRKMKTEKGLALVPGANPLADSEGSWNGHDHLLWLPR